MENDGDVGIGGEIEVFENLGLKGLHNSSKRGRIIVVAIIYDDRGAY